ncbi:glutathione S-transferase C-terminal domain-containing protein [Streptomyces collinus]|uniref:glutathione S-transferase C-terminal domain-containing protein n=1 Tax=Streptomyces collinus TaxID=42684 RepID=UPI001062FC03
MSIASLATVPATPCTATPRTVARRGAPSFRGRIGQDARSGHYAVPHRYRLHLSTGCADGLRLAVGHSLLGLDAVCPVVFLPALPDRSDGGHSALRPLYEASAHHWTGPALAPVLSDDWAGRIVSNHAPDILRDLDRFPREGRFALYPCGTESRIDAVERLCSEGVLESARCAARPGADPAERAAALEVLLDTLGRLERHLEGEEYVVDGRLTAADVELWVALVRLHTVHRHHLDASAARRVAAHPVLWAHVRRLTDLPAFGGHLGPDGVDGPAAGA